MTYRSFMHDSPACLKATTARLFDLILPTRCLACGDDFEGPPQAASLDTPQLCRRCHDSLNLQMGSVCKRCAAQVPAYSHHANSCLHCTEPRLWFDQTFALGPYEGGLRKLVLRMKQDKSETIAETLGKLLYHQLTGAGQSDMIRSATFPTKTMVVPIPMHPIRQITRGTNSAVALAKTIGRLWRLPVAYRLLKRKRNTLLQKGLSKSLRFANLRGGISVKRGYPLGPYHIVLVDDILTTGATCSEAARVLKQAGASTVTILTIARTPA